MDTGGRVTDQIYKFESKDPNEEIDETDYRQMKTTKGDKYILFLLMLINPIVVLLRGNSLFPSIIGNKKCSKLDTWIFTSYFVVVLIITVINAVRLIKRNKTSIVNGKQISLEPKKLAVLIIGIMVIGCIGTYISAGSTLFGLLLIFTGLSPFVASPTSLIISAMSSASTTFIFFLNGQIDLKLGFVGSLIILACSLGTRVTIYNFMLKKGKESMLMMFIIILTLVSIPANLVKVIPEVISDYVNGKNVMAFSKVC